MAFTYRWYLKDLANVKPNGLKVFSCFAGGGGSSMGYKMLGCDVIGHLDIDPKMVSVYRTNLSPAYSFCEDLRTFNARTSLPSDFNDLDILDASPPCTLFSGANLVADKFKGVKRAFKEGGKEQVLDDLFFIAIDTVEKLQPKLVIFENVSGLLHQKNLSYVHRIITKLRSIGYAVHYKLLNSMHMGVPQSRARVFFIAVRNDILSANGLSSFTLATRLNLSFSEPVIPYRDFFKPDPSPEWPLSPAMKRLWDLRSPTDTSFSTIRFRVDGKKHSLFTHGLVQPDRPCCTLTARVACATSSLEPRALSTYERLLASSFPLDYKFTTYKSDYIVGMSVPPLMIYKIVGRVLSRISLS